MRLPSTAFAMLFSLFSVLLAPCLSKCLAVGFYFSSPGAPVSQGEAGGDEAPSPGSPMAEDEVSIPLPGDSFSPPVLVAKLHWRDDVTRGFLRPAFIHKPPEA